MLSDCRIGTISRTSRNSPATACDLSDVIKALSLGTKAVGPGSCYLFPLSAAGQPGVKRALSLMHEELLRDMKLIGAHNVANPSCSNLGQRGIPLT